MKYSILAKYHFLERKRQLCLGCFLFHWPRLYLQEGETGDSCSIHLDD
jgi:hypothetical protein